MSQQYYIKRVDTRGIRQDMYVKLWDYINIDFEYSKQNATVFEGKDVYVILATFLGTFSENKDYFEYFKEPIPKKQYVIVSTEDGKYFNKKTWSVGFYNNTEYATIYDDEEACYTDAKNLKLLLPDINIAVKTTAETIDTDF